MILVCLVFFLHACSIDIARVLTTFPSLSLSDKSEMSRFLRADTTFLMNNSFSLLFFAIENLDMMIFFSVIGIVIVRGGWSEESHQSGWIE